MRSRVETGVTQNTAAWVAELLWITLVLAALFGAYLGHTLVGDRALLAADMLFRDPVWRARAPDGYQGPSNSLLTDQVYQFYPWLHVAHQQLRSGRWPLWNPYIYDGSPLVANDQSAVFYPINLLLNLLPPHQIPGWSAFFRLLIAGLGVYALMRHWAASPLAGLASAMTFTLGGYLIRMAGYPLVNVLAWLPWMILCTDHIVSSHTPLPWILLCALCIGFQFLGGHAETSFFIVIAWSFYSVVATLKLSTNPKAVLQGLVRLCIPFIVGSAIAAVQLVPFLELLPQSNFYAYRNLQASQSPLFYRGFWRESLMLVTLFFPRALGDSTTGDWWLGTAFVNAASNLYIGILPLFLALMASWLRRREWRCAFWGMLSLLSLAGFLRWPLVDLIRRIPLFNISNMIGFSELLPFGLALLAGFGLDTIVSADKKAHRILSTSLMLFSILGSAMLFGGYVALRLFKQTWLALGRHYIETYIYGIPPHPYSLDHYLAQLEPRYQQILNIVSPHHRALYVPICFAVGGALILLAARCGRMRSRSIGVAFVLLIGADLWLSGSAFNPSIDRNHLYPRTPALDFLSTETQHDRIVGLGDILPPNTGMLFGLYDVRGYDVGIGRYATFLERLRLSPAICESGEQILDLVGARYLLSAERLPETPYCRRLYDAEIAIYEYMGALPRAYLVFAYRVIPDPTELLDHLDDPDVTSGQAVLLEAMPPAPVSPPLHKSGTADITVYQPEVVTISVNAPDTALLVLSDTFYPGWKALVDNRETTIYRANYTFRAIVVPAGQHTVSFIYRPVSFRIGAWISLSTLALVALGSGASLWQWVRKRAET